MGVGYWVTVSGSVTTVPDRSKIKGKRDYTILALLLDCALRRQELICLDVDGIEMREGRSVARSLWTGGRVRNHGDSTRGQARNRRLDGLRSILVVPDRGGFRRRVTLVL